jgi:hypothetical protein
MERSTYFKNHAEYTRYLDKLDKSVEKGEIEEVRYFLN